MRKQYIQVVFSEEAVGSYMKPLNDPMDDSITTPLEVLEEHVDNLRRGCTMQVEGRHLSRCITDDLSLMLSALVLDDRLPIICTTQLRGESEVQVHDAEELQKYPLIMNSTPGWE